MKSNHAEARYKELITTGHPPTSEEHVITSEARGLTGYCFKYIDRPFCLHTDELCIWKYSHKPSAISTCDIFIIISADELHAE